nr:TlpA disulfide reductase family protein [Allomuricauda sp.]
MNFKTFGTIFLVCLVFSCKNGGKETILQIHSAQVNDTIIVEELVTDKKFAELSEAKQLQKINLKWPAIASIKSSSNNSRYLTILKPHQDLNIFIGVDSSISTHKKCDSILNYLSKSNLDFANNNLDFIFKTEKLDSIPVLFDAFRKKREEEINKIKGELSPRDFAILSFQNKATIYSFLLWFGRVSKKLEPSHSYYNFIKNIPPPDWTAMTFPSIYLYKYEIEYLQKNPSVQSNSDFMIYLEEEVPHRETSEVIKALYIKGLITLPSYWSKHVEHFNAEVLDNILIAEKDNNYFSMIQEAAQSFYKSQNKMVAYNFKAIDHQNKPFQLEDLKEKVVFIDVWATWCGPCIKERPKVLELAKKYSDNHKVEIIMLSVDSSKESWDSFLEKEGKQPGLNLFIQNGMKTDFGSHFNVTEIPRYILIGMDGRILNSRIEMTKDAIEKDIEIAIGITQRTVP